MGSELDLHGIYVPLITPFSADGAVAYGEIERLANESLDAGAAGLVALGTTGEPATLDDAERKRVIEIIGGVCRARSAHFCVGAGTNSTAEAERMTKEATDAGAGSILSVVPYYTRPSEAGIVEHFKALAAASATPLIVYNIPSRTGRGLGAASLLELADTPNIAGLKQAVGGVDADTLSLLAAKPPDFHVLSGDDPFTYSLMCSGGAGAIAASAHVLTGAFVQMVDAARKGDMATARELSEALLPVCLSLFSEPGPTVVKAAVFVQGRISTPNMRLPMTAASSKAMEAAKKAIATAEEKLTAR